MAYRVFFLNRLHKGVAAADYENWVRTTDYPVARRHPAVQRYDVTRLEATIDGKDAPSFDYLEVLEVTSIEEYREALATSEFKQLLEEWSKYVASEAVHGEVID
jgi:REDY-like protein HapK